MKHTTALIAFATQTHAQTQEEIDKYPRWATEMDHYGYTWEAFEVTTEDDYILTTFHITGTKDGGAFTPDKDAVLIMHGHS